MPNSRMLASTTTLNASLISHRSMSLMSTPARARATGVAAAGATVNSTGGSSASPNPFTSASGTLPSSAALLALISTNAAAPSLIDDALTAVIVPVFEKAGFSVATLLGSSLRGSSSCATTVSGLPRAPLMVMGSISSLNMPASSAATARWYDATAKLSWSSREKEYFSAHFSPARPMCDPSKPSVKPSRRMPSCVSPWQSR
mmetsp:Transcript_13444/g.34294  ORF Transcript_13444/g.34294 Transcript_13444/m.34294 type:complete len:202 (+) Transcript_13444:281-886(+)